MQRGSSMEPIIADEFAAETGLTFRRAGLQRSKTYPHLLGNVDRLADDGGGVEIKRTDSYGISKKILTGDYPPYWLWQCLTYLTVTGRSHWWLVAMLPTSHAGVRWL
jgi:YqaJ-like viral recombinase domain